MTPFRPKGRTIYRVKVPNRHGGWKDKSTGTKDRPTARAMDRMVEDLGAKGTRAWDLLDAVHDGRLSLGALFDAYRMDDLDGLRARLEDVDLRPVLARWQAWLTGRVRQETKERYQVHVASLAGTEGPWWRSTLTPDAAEKWLSGLERSAGTKRKYYAALESFCGYAVQIGALEVSPLASLSPPPAPAPAPEFLELPDVHRVLDAADEPFRSLFTFLYGTGCDVSVALELCRRDIETASHEVRARGTKNHNRDRTVTVADWAWPSLAERCRTLLPDAPLWPGISRYWATDVHREILKRLKLYREGINLHAARNHWAVRMIRAGTPIELVSRQLGHKDGVLCLKVYGRFIPDAAERRKWEKQAAKAEKRRIHA